MSYEFFAPLELIFDEQCDVQAERNLQNCLIAHALLIVEVIIIKVNAAILKARAAQREEFLSEESSTLFEEEEDDDIVSPCLTFQICCRAIHEDSKLRGPYSGNQVVIILGRMVANALAGKGYDVNAEQDVGDWWCGYDHPECRRERLHNKVFQITVNK